MLWLLLAFTVFSTLQKSDASEGKTAKKERVSDAKKSDAHSGDTTGEQVQTSDGDGSDEVKAEEKKQVLPDCAIEGPNDDFATSKSKKKKKKRKCEERSDEEACKESGGDIVMQVAEEMPPSEKKRKKKQKHTDTVCTKPTVHDGNTTGELEPGNCELPEPVNGSFVVKNQKKSKKTKREGSQSDEISTANANGLHDSRSNGYTEETELVADGVKKKKKKSKKTKQGDTITDGASAELLEQIEPVNEEPSTIKKKKKVAITKQEDMQVDEMVNGVAPVDVALEYINGTTPNEKKKTKKRKHRELEGTVQENGAALQLSDSCVVGSRIKKHRKHKQ